MQDAQKIAIIDQIINLINQADKESVPVMVGSLTKPFGINGFQTAEIGHPVFEFNNKYILYLERNDGKLTVEIPFYQLTLKEFIKFL
jgi:hypothetical protein